MSRVLLITGATGHLGKTVLHHLRKHSEKTAVLVRDITKFTASEIDIYIGNYDDKVSLVHAMRDITKVLLIASNNEDHRVQQHQ